MQRNPYTGYHADCYVLTSVRTGAFVISFLNKFLPHRTEVASEYEIPKYAQNPDNVFASIEDLLQYLENVKSEGYALYWTNLDVSELRHAMCFFTNDGNLILGLSTATMWPNPEIEDKYLQMLKAFSNTGDGIIRYEQPPPLVSAEFLELVHRARDPL